ncbi:MAG: hypothetical protein A4E48_00195 [Methanosaeta sp. PtaU1.Bin060]|nr:MAG: hypothetical protein A4E48_00195 [Methanosaeta sp. PtaU1.Bin060]
MHALWPQTYDRFKWSTANETAMDEDLSEVFQMIAEDERRRRYLKEIGDWLVEEYFELHQAS